MRTQADIKLLSDSAYRDRDRFVVKRDIGNSYIMQCVGDALRWAAGEDDALLDGLALKEAELQELERLERMSEVSHEN